MPAETEERFQSSNKCCIWNKLFDAGDNKVRDHCHITGKYRRSAHCSCNINLKLTKKFPVIFYHLRGYDRHLIMQEICETDVKISVMPNGLEKYMTLKFNNNLVFIYSMQFIIPGLNAFVFQVNILSI